MSGNLLPLVVAAMVVATSGIVAMGVGRSTRLAMLQTWETDRLRQGLELAELPNLPELVKQLNLTKLDSALVTAGLVVALSVEGNFTLFAPTDQAFMKIPDITNVTVLTAVLEYHVLAGKVLSGDIKKELTVKTLLGLPIRFNIYPNNKITAQCAPIDLNNVDKMASNGVLHELNAVMIPPMGNIVQFASSVNIFQTLVTALKIANLVNFLSDPGPFTVFAPTDMAFRKLDPEFLKNLLKDKKELTDVLTYHVANNTYCSAGLVSYKTLTMLNGDKVNISLDGGKVKVNDAMVLPKGTDVSVTNGVVHAIDTVLIPPTLRSHPQVNTRLLYRGLE